MRFEYTPTSPEIEPYLVKKEVVEEINTDVPGEGPRGNGPSTKEKEDNKMAKKPEAVRRWIVSGIMRGLGMKKTHLTWSGNRKKKADKEVDSRNIQTGLVKSGEVHQ